MTVEYEPYEPHWLERAVVMMGGIITGWVLLLVLFAVPAAALLWVVGA